MLTYCMNRCFIRFLVYGTLAIIVIYLLATWRLGRRKVVRQELVMVGVDIITKTNSENITHIKPKLHQQLSALLGSTGRVARIDWGDVKPPLGDGQATACLILSNSVGKKLGIRFRYVGRGKFEPIGFWTNVAELNDRPKPLFEAGRRPI